VLRAVSVAAVVASTLIYLQPVALPTALVLRNPLTSPGPPPDFPTQFSGLRTFYNAAVRELCLVAAADAPTGMGGAPRINKNGTVYAVYLVETSDPNASSVRLQTSSGTKAARLKT